MPELPDIAAYITALESRIVGEPLEHVRLVSSFLLRTVEPPIASVEGRRVRELRRVGKRIAVGVEDDLWLVLHLMIAGRLHWRAAGAKLAGRNQLAAFQAGRRVRVPICFDGVRNKCQKFQLRLPQPELPDGSLPIAMHLFMAGSTEGDQVFFGVITAVTAKFLVVNL